MNNLRLKIGQQCVLLTLCVLLSQCTNKEEVIVINPLANACKEFSVDLINTIQLANEDNALIGAIDMLSVFNDRIYILDKKKVSSLLIFDMQGGLIKRIPRGHGPGELINVESFGFVSNKLIIIDQFHLKHYSLKGDYLLSEKLPEGWFVWSFIESGNDKILLHGSADIDNSLRSDIMQKHHVVDKSFSKCFSSHLSVKKEFLAIKENQPASYFDGSHLIADRPYNYIYELDGSDLSKKYFVDFGIFNFKDDEIEKGLKHISQLYKTGLRFGYLDNVIENNEILHFNYYSWSEGRGKAHSIIYSKTKKKSAPLDDILKVADLPFLYVSQAIDDLIVCYLLPGELDDDDIMKFNKANFLNTNIYSNSNPVIMLAKIE